MRSERIMMVSAFATALAVSSILAACGGGGGDSGSGGSGTSANAAGTGASLGSSGATGGNTNTSASGTTSTSTATPVATTPVADGKLHAACTSCGASDDQTYNGTGVGLWQASNTSTQNAVVNISLQNVGNRNFVYVFTNDGTDQTMPNVTISTDVTGFVSKSMATGAPKTAESTQMQAIREFNNHGWAALTTRGADTANGAVANAVAKAVQHDMVANVVGSTQRAFWLADGTQRQSTLEGTQATQDGTTVNVWVENAEYSATKVTPKIVQELLSTYAGKGGVYDIVTSIGGAVWGKTNYTGVIAATGQPIDLVVTNFNPDGQPYGLVGYFYSLNNFVNAGSGATAHSNQDLSLYLDSETLYLAGDAGLQAMKTTMAHESEHLQAFYRRSMSLGEAYTYDSWVEEMMAMMMEDWASFNLDVTYNSVRDGRFPEFLSYNGQGSYTCGLDNWQPAGSACDSYSTNGTFGGFLNRQFGLAFYKAVLTDSSSTDTKTAFSNVVGKFSPGTTLAQLMRRFAIASEAQIPAASKMTTYGFPARQEGGFSLPAIDPANFRRYLPSASPTTFQGLSSFPAVRTNMSNSYQESLTLPPNTSVTVVVQ